jgi:hypothetical protein
VAAGATTASNKPRRSAEAKDIFPSKQTAVPVSATKQTKAGRQSRKTTASELGGELRFTCRKDTNIQSTPQYDLTMKT